MGLPEGGGSEHSQNQGVFRGPLSQTLSGPLSNQRELDKGPDNVCDKGAAPDEDGELRAGSRLALQNPSLPPIFY